MSKIGIRIQQLRKNLGISQNEVANHLGIHRPSVSQIEHGERDVSASELIMLAELFRVRPESMFESPNKPSSSTASETVITFCRHGEAIDDIYNQYGGWHDPELSPKGVTKAYTETKRLLEEGDLYDIVLTSPLQRARRKGEIISSELKIDVKVLSYLIERNTYGILSGLNKDSAKKQYPKLVEEYEKGNYVLGSERKDDFQKRIQLIFKYIKDSGYKKPICVTHGKVLTEILESTLKKHPENLDEDCTLIVGVPQKGKPYIKSTSGITFYK